MRTGRAWASSSLFLGLGLILCLSLSRVFVGCLGRLNCCAAGSLTLGAVGDSRPLKRVALPGLFVRRFWRTFFDHAVRSGTIHVDSCLDHPCGDEAQSYVAGPLDVTCACTLHGTCLPAFLLSRVVPLIALFCLRVSFTSRFRSLCVLSHASLERNKNDELT